MTLSPGRRAALLAALSAAPFALALAAPAPAAAKPAEPLLADATAGSGIAYRNVSGAQGRGKGWLTETIGAGAAWLDYDGDGSLDLYIVNGSTHERPADTPGTNRLYRGDGRGRFTDVTQKAGVAGRGWGYGAAAGDYDNDGDTDLLVTTLRSDILYRNNGDGTFADVSQKAGITGSGWGTSAAFFDMDNDGDLDLYVARYVAFDRDKVPRRGTKEAIARTCLYKTIPVVCGPLGLPPSQDTLYRNNGNGSFTDVSREAGILLPAARYGLGVVTGDYDNDGDQDVFVADDSVPNLLWRNLGNGAFRDVGVESLCALSAEGDPQAGMGTDMADYDDDGWLDIGVTNFSQELNSIFRSQSGRFFNDVSTSIGMQASYSDLSWGMGFHDFDQDGDQDLFIANGHVYPDIDDYGLGTTFNQPNTLYVNEGGRMRAAPRTAGLEVARSFRGAAFGDYDNDGDVDVFVVALDGAPLLLRNDTPAAGSWLQVSLRGRASNRDGVGARVTARAGGLRVLRERKGGGSYLSASDPRLHFGLGGATKVETLEIRWPSGRTQTLQEVPAGRILVVREPE